MIELLANAHTFAAGAIRGAQATAVGGNDTPRMVGPVVVLAQVRPLEVEPGALAPDFDVRPHPHVGLAAITYVIEGYVTHRDSLGTRQEIGPGSLSCLIAGRGMVHSERFERLRLLGGRLHMLQILLALPDGAQDGDPSFEHAPSAAVPERAEAGATVRRLLDLGEPAAAAFPGDAFVHDVRLEAGGRYAPPEGVSERALYVLSGEVTVGDRRVGPQQTALLSRGAASVVAGSEPARVVAFGGEPVGPRYMWWNFIHSSLDVIDGARAAWRAGETPRPPGDTESFTPAPADDGRPLLHLGSRG